MTKDALADLIKGHKKDMDSARQILVGRSLGAEPGSDEQERIRDAILSHEVAIMDLWTYAFDKSSDNGASKKKFHELCGDCLQLLRALSEPEDEAELVLHRLKTLSYAYLGEKGEQAQALARIWGEIRHAGDSWRDVVLSSILSAILLLVRKTSLEDLNRAAESIQELRNAQAEMEGPYLESLDAEHKRGAAFELASMYHLAKCVELTAEYMQRGSDRRTRVMLDMQIDKAVSYCERCGHRDLEMVERMLHLMFKKMIENSIWSVAYRAGPVKEFAHASVKSANPVFELLYPQRAAVLERGLLDPASRAAVVSMPTSSGKTLMAELKIVQAVREAPSSWVAYVAPTRALVNQAASRLRQDLKGLEITVEKMSGALDLDEFEQNMIGSNRRFNVLVLTPEKMSMMIRRRGDLRESLSLAVIDEAHNLSEDQRGLRLEMLLATLKSALSTNLLLLTPFIPNVEQVARWLDPEAAKTIKLDMTWRSGNSVVGLYYPKGRGKSVSTNFLPLLYAPSAGTASRKIENQELKICDVESDYTMSKIKGTKYVLTSIVAQQLAARGNVLVLAPRVADTWKMAKELASLMPKRDEFDKRILLVKKFIGVELGQDFPLIGYLERGIGVHNAGMPEEVRQLVEWLMEEDLIKVLVSTTTLAQGVDFPVSSVLISSLSPGGAGMRPHEFWNIAGRTGRVGQNGAGFVGIAAKGQKTQDALRATRFVERQIRDTASAMKNLAKELARGSDLHTLASDPVWSNFVQYISHMYTQSNDLRDFASRIEFHLRNTYGYQHLGPDSQQALTRAVDEYGKLLDGKKDFSRMSNMTGFSPETAEAVSDSVESMKMQGSDWTVSGMFGDSSRLEALVRTMTEKMPEIREISEVKASQKTISPLDLSMIIRDWVSGKPITHISEKYFGGTGVDSLSQCVGALHGKVLQYATWAMSAIHQAYRARLEPESRSNLPAMVYYGVDSDAAILMRMNGMPRSLSTGIGGMYERDHKDLYGAQSSYVLGWLNDLPDGKWTRPETDAGLSGTEYKQIWRRLAGLDHATGR